MITEKSRRGASLVPLKFRAGAEVIELDSQCGMRRIALAEDDVEMRRILAFWLREDGYEVLEAENGLQVLDAIGSVIPSERLLDIDMIVSDVRMPETGGLRLLEQLRRFDQRTPVVLITAFGDSQLREKAARLGAAAVLDKPFDVDELRRLVNELMPPE